LSVSRSGPARQIGGAPLQSLQPRRLGEVDPESVTLPLISAGHLGTGVTELSLDVALIGLCGGGEASAQGVSRKLPPPLGLRKIAPHPRGERRAFYESCHMPVGEPIGPSLAAPRDPPEQRPMRDAAEL
jgi:hypothetical protein